MKWFYFVLLFPIVALAQAGGAPGPSRFASDIIYIKELNNSVTVTAIDVATQRPGVTNWNAPTAEKRVCYRPNTSGAWTTCGPWVAEVALTNPLAESTISGLANGDWCFRVQSRDAATLIGSVSGLSIGDGGPDGSCCIRVPSKQRRSCDAIGGRYETMYITQTVPPTVSYWKLFWGTAPGVYTQEQVVTKTSYANGEYSGEIYQLSGDIYVAAKAYGSNGLISAYSNEVLRAAAPAAPPTALSAITQVKLWDASGAQLDTELQANFPENGTISNQYRNCVAIEAVGNPYMDAGPGSIQFVLDGVSHCESNPPYANGGDQGNPGWFVCDPGLASIGQHTLVMTPYDVDSCTGSNIGPAVTRHFTTSGF